MTLNLTIAALMLTVAGACQPIDPSAGAVSDSIGDVAGGPDAAADGQNQDAAKDAPEDAPSDTDGGFKVPKEDDASVVSVTFALHNPTDHAIYVGVEGTFCQAWGIEGLEMVKWYECLCECGAPESSDVLSGVIVEAGETYKLHWDGRSVGRSLETRECWTGELVDFWRPYWKAAPEGRYTFFVSVFDAAPEQHGSPGDPDTIAWEKAEVCSVVDQVARVGFELPASGALTVDVDLSVSESGRQGR